MTSPLKFSPHRNRTVLLLVLSVMVGAALPAVSTTAFAGDAKPAEDKKPNGEGGNGKDAAKKIDEIAEAAKFVAGPAGQPECVWVGRRIVGLLWRDDLETANRHRELYEKFGCPFPHIQDSFRCVVRNGELDPKAPEALSLRIHACWVNPALMPPPPAVAADAAAQPTAPAAPAP